MLQCLMLMLLSGSFNTMRPRQNGRHFPDDFFKCIFMNENVLFLIKISLKFVPKAPIDNIPALVQIMAWRRLGNKPLSDPMMVSLLTHICVTRPQWVKAWLNFCFACYVIIKLGNQVQPALFSFMLSRNNGVKSVQKCKLITWDWNIHA